MSSSRRPFALALTLVSLVACDGDKVTGNTESGALSVADAKSLIRAVAPQMQQSVSSISSGSGSATSNTALCAHGGTVRASLSTGSGSTGVVTMVHSACKVDGPDGRVWTVNGDPNLRLTVGSITLPSTPVGVVVITMTVAGTLQVAGGTVSGRCPIDTNFQIRTSTTATASSTVRYTGRVCDQVVDETLMPS